jgi:predicted Holliday junction resolvase-like endonuclease
MEITSFVLGMFTMIVVIIITVIVVGVFKIKNIIQEIKNIQESNNWESRSQGDNNREIHERLSRMDEQAYRHMEEQKRETISYIDSRIDKLQSKKEVDK